METYKCWLLLKMCISHNDSCNKSIVTGASSPITSDCRCFAFMQLLRDSCLFSILNCYKLQTPVILSLLLSEDACQGFVILLDILVLFSS